MYWRCAVQTTLVSAVFQRCASVCTCHRQRSGEGWHVEGSGLHPKGAGAAREAGSGRAGRRWPLGQVFTSSLETSEWVPESGIFAASREVGGLPNSKSSRCLVRYLHVPHGRKGKAKGGQTPAAKNCRRFSTLQPYLVSVYSVQSGSYAV